MSPESQSQEPIDKDWNDLSKLKPVPLLPPERLAEFVMAYCDGKIFTLHDLREGEAAQIAHVVFMPILFGSICGGVCGFRPDDVGTFWEYYSEAGPRAINGYPCFTSMHVMAKLDWDKATKAIKRELERRRDATKSVLDDLDEG